MRYSCIVWDWNGTLLNDAALCLDIMNGILRSRDLPEMSLARYQEIFDFPVSHYYEKLGFDYTRDSFESLGTQFIEEYEQRKDTCPLQDEALEILAALHARGIRQAVLSAYQHDALVALLAARKLDGYFDCILGIDNHYAHGKEEQGKDLIARLKPKPGTALMIGDTMHDHAVAQAIGIDCILVTGGHQSETRLRTCGCPVFSNLEAAASWLED